jgi:peptidoglycan hydrolase CwlO-like protein
MNSMAKGTQTKYERSQRKWINYLLNRQNDIEVEIADLWKTVTFIKKEIEELKQRIDKIER